MIVDKDKIWEAISKGDVFKYLQPLYHVERLLKEYIKIFNDDISSKDDLDVFEFRGMKINIIPFLINGLSLLNSDDELVQRSFSNMLSNLSDVDYESIEDFKKFLNSDNKDLKLLNCLVPFDNFDNRRVLFLYAYYINKKQFLKVIIDSYFVSCLKDSVYLQLDYSVFDNSVQSKKYEDSARLSFILSCCFALSYIEKCSQSNKRIIKNFDELKEYWNTKFDEYFIRNSYLGKYMRGEISLSKMYYNYFQKESKIGLPNIVYRYYVTYNHDKLSKLKYPDKHIDNLKFEDSLTYNFYKCAIDKLFYSEANLDDIFSIFIKIAYNNGTFNKLQKAADLANESAQNAQKKFSSEHKKYVDEVEKSKKLEKEVKQLSKELSKCKPISDVKQEFYDKLRDKDKEISKLKNKIADLQDFIDNSDDEHIKYRRKSVALERKVKKLELVVNSNPSMQSDLDDINDDINITVQEASDYIRNKRIFIAGGNDSSHFEDVFNKYGLHNITRVNKSKGNTKFNYDTKYDLVVLLWKAMSHSLQYACNKYFKNVPRLYFGGEDVDKLIMEMYEAFYIDEL